MVKKCKVNWERITLTTRLPNLQYPVICPVASLTSNTFHLYIPKKRGTENPAAILTPNVALSLDRAKISDRKAALVLPTIAHALGHDASKLPTSFSSIRRARQMQRLTEAEKIKDTFSPISPLTHHWDSKLLPSAPGIYRYYLICN